MIVLKLYLYSIKIIYSALPAGPVKSLWAAIGSNFILLWLLLFGVSLIYGFYIRYRRRYFNRFRNALLAAVISIIALFSVLVYTFSKNPAGMAHGAGFIAIASLLSCFGGMITGIYLKRYPSLQWYLACTVILGLVLFFVNFGSRRQVIDMTREDIDKKFNGTFARDPTELERRIIHDAFPTKNAVPEPP